RPARRRRRGGTTSTPRTGWSPCPATCTSTGCHRRRPRRPADAACGSHMELRTDELTLHSKDDGNADAPPILVLHGITQSTATWGWLVPHLAADHRVVRLDFRGHGLSGRTPGAYSFRGYVADATA